MEESGEEPGRRFGRREERIVGGPGRNAPLPL